MYGNEHQCEVSRRDLDSTSRELMDQIYQLERRINQLENDLNEERHTRRTEIEAVREGV